MRLRRGGDVVELAARRVGGEADVTLRANQFENVEMPLVDEVELERRAAVRRAELAARREPIMHLSFDEVKDGYVVDQSGMGFDGECDATVDLSQEGVKGTCATFDGKSPIVVPRGRDLDLDTVTVSAWIKPANLDGRYGLISKRTGNNGAPYIVTMNGATLGFEATDSGGAWSFNFGAQGVIQAGVWQHVAAVLQYGVGVRLYVNGREVGRLDNPASVCRNGQGLTLGWEAWGGPQVRSDEVGWYFGSLDEVKVWARVLSEEEVAQEAVR